MKTTVSRKDFTSDWKIEDLKQAIEEGLKSPSKHVSKKQMKSKTRMAHKSS